MLGKFFSHLLGNATEDLEAADATLEELMESEEGGWIIVNLPDVAPLSAPEADPLENLLIEHPSMSVYQMRCRRSGVEEEEEEERGSDEEDGEDAASPVAVSRQHVSWRLAAWGTPLPCGFQLLAMQRARSQAERKTLSRGSLHRQNLSRLRCSSPSEKRYGFFKQPSQRLYNY